MADVKTVQVEVWVVVDAQGAYGVGPDEQAACDQFSEDNSFDDGPTRRVRVVLTIPVPTTIEVSAVIPPEPAGATVSVR